MFIKDFPISNGTKSRFISAGFLTEDDFRDKFLEDLLDLDGVGKGSLLEMREYLHSKFGIVLKRKPKAKKVKNFKQAQLVVNHLLSHVKKPYWARELPLADKLLTIKDLQFWLGVKPFQYTQSLNYYLSDNGRNYIKQFLPLISFETPEDRKEEEQQVEEVELKELSYLVPKNIRDFLNLQQVG